MKIMDLTLTNNQGEVLKVWSIGDRVETDPEDTEGEEEHDFYADENWQETDDIGVEIMVALVQQHRLMKNAEPS